MRNSWGFNQIIYTYIYVCMDIKKDFMNKNGEKENTSSKHGYKSWALLGFLQEEMGFTLEVMDLYNLVDDLSMKIVQQIKSMVYVLVDDSRRKDMIIVSPENHLYIYGGDESNCSAPNLVLLSFWFVPHKWQAFMDQNWHLCLPNMALSPWNQNGETQVAKYLFSKKSIGLPICMGLLKRDGRFFRWRNGAVEAPMTLGPMMLIHLMRKGYIYLNCYPFFWAKCSFWRGYHIYTCIQICI